MPTYDYRVLRRVSGRAEIPEGATVFIDCGVHNAKTGDAAALTAAEEEAPAGHRGAGIYHPISLRHFGETPIVPTTGLAIGDRVAGGEEGSGAEESGGGDPPPPIPPAAGDDLDPRIDPAHPCEWTDGGEHCEHAPGDHGAKGLGTCRVEGCPCGRYVHREREIGT